MNVLRGNLLDAYAIGRNLFVRRNQAEAGRPAVLDLDNDTVLAILMEPSRTANPNGPHTYSAGR